MHRINICNYKGGTDNLGTPPESASICSARFSSSADGPQECHSAAPCTDW